LNPKKGKNPNPPTKLKEEPVLNILKPLYFDWI
jgi:hypothetical protein